MWNKYFPPPDKLLAKEKDRCIFIYQKPLQSTPLLAAGNSATRVLDLNLSRKASPRG